MENQFGIRIPPLTDAFAHPQARHEVNELFHAVGLSLGLGDADARALPAFVHRTLAARQHHAEETIRDWIARKAVAPEMAARIDARSAQICSQVAPFVTGSVIADIGCGDGLVAAGVARERECFLVDVVEYVDARVTLPFQRYSGAGRLPITKPVDCSLLLTVLHHSDDPRHLLSETMRVTQKRIIVIESVVPDAGAPDFDAQFLVAALFDWFYNRVIHKDVPVPFNYNSVAGWQDLFEQQGWRVVHIQDFGRDQALVPERHVLFVLDRV